MVNEKMVDENKPLDHSQVSMSDNPEVSQQMPSETTSAEINPHHESEMGAESSTTHPYPGDRSMNDDVLDPGLESAVDQQDTPEQAPQAVDERSSVEELTKQLEGLKLQLEERTGQCIRMAADFDNFRKRTQKEKEDLEQQVKCSTVVELLPVVDNFERARLQIKPQTDPEMAIHKSYQGVYKDLVERLKRIGVSPMRAEGKEFDPTMHEAVMRESTDEYAEGTVIEELVRGYVLGDRVLRHAMVKVAATPEPVVASENDYQGDTEE